MAVREPAQAGRTYQGHDRLYVPKVANTTGDLDIHDIAIDGDGRPVFVATKFGCIATLAVRSSFTPLWRPAFLSKLAAEDRCHLNGLAMEEGRPRYVTAVSQSDVVDGWRDRRQNGGVVLEVPESRVLASGLSMPHSPRLYRGRLWLHNSGTGQFGSIDPGGGPFEPLTFCPGYLRGLAFVGDYAVVGLSQPRHEKTFSGLALETELAKRDAEPRCGLLDHRPAHRRRRALDPCRRNGPRTLRRGRASWCFSAHGPGFQVGRDRADHRRR